jgi:uncharacterized protein YecE (DUF72 family)
MRAGKILIGCCGFPLGLARYSEIFPVVEVQQTFYQPPLARTCVNWRGRVPPEFEFTLKAWQLITHEGNSPTYRRLREKLTTAQRQETGAFRLNRTVLMAWERTLECARLLKSRLILFQCPARFAPTPENKANLRSFFGHIKAQARSSPDVRRLVFAWEPRGEWKIGEVQELCQEFELFHAVDPFKQKPATPGPAYFRLHGVTGYRYKFTEHDFANLVGLARVHNLCYIMFNNISMLEDARRFLARTSSQALP